MQDNSNFKHMDSASWMPEVPQHERTTTMRLSAKNPLDFSDQHDPTRAMRACDEFLANETVTKSVIRPITAGVVKRVRKL